MLVIFSYVSDPETICSLEAVCQDFRAVIMKNSDAIWERLHRQRWTIFAPSNILKNKAEYGRRHQLDASAIKWIGRLQESSSSSTTIYHHRRLMLDAVTHILASGKYVLDACWNVWKNTKKEENEELLMRELVHLLHCYTVCEDLVGLLGRSSSSSSTSQEAPTAAPTRIADSEDNLEECVILTSKIFYQLDKEDTLGDTKSQWIRNEFDRIANKVREHADGICFDEHAPEMNIAQKIRAVHKVLFFGGDELSLAFTGNVENYYECDNSLLHVTLERRKAIPMTLAIIYKCICRRLGIQAYIIGLPGHIVVHVPEWCAQYVDVFHSGRLLTRQDCERIVNMHGFAMQDSYLEPLSTHLVVCRVLKNMENCLERREINQVGRGNVIRRAYLTTAFNTLSSGEHNDNDAKLETCRRLLGLAWVTEVEQRLLDGQNLP